MEIPTYEECSSKFLDGKILNKLERYIHRYCPIDETGYDANWSEEFGEMLNFAIKEDKNQEECSVNFVRMMLDLEGDRKIGETYDDLAERLIKDYEDGLYTTMEPFYDYTVVGNKRIPMTKEELEGRLKEYQESTIYDYEGSIGSAKLPETIHAYDSKISKVLDAFEAGMGIREQYI